MLWKLRSIVVFILTYANDDGKSNASQNYICSFATKIQLSLFDLLWHLVRIVNSP